MKRKVFGKKLLVAMALAMTCTVGVGVANAATKDITLVEGWNLINTPLEPDDAMLDTVLTGQSYISAWVWDASKGNWQVRVANEGVDTLGDYAASKGFATLYKIHSGQGMWVNMTAGDTLTITGTAPTTNTTINPVAKGWNLIGTRSDATKTVAQLVTTLGDGAKPLSIWKWKGSKWAVALPFNADGTAVTDGGASYATSKGFDLLADVTSTEGYWVNAIGASGTVTPPDNGSGTTAISKFDESCMVCHTAGKMVDIAAVGHASPTAVAQTISDVAVTSVAGVPQVAFHVATAAGPVTTLSASSVRVYMADLVTTVAANGTIPATSYFAQWAAERSTTAGITFTNLGNGDYTWTMSQPFGTATASSGLNDDAYSANDIQRLVLRVSGTTNVTTNAVAVLDYNVTANGLTVTPLAYTARQYVTVEACKKCHGPLMVGAAHGSAGNGYQDTRACVICHSPLYGTSDADEPLGFMKDDLDIVFAPFIHKIHAAIDVPAFPTRIKGNGYVDVTYPQEISNCEVCHTNSGLALGDGDEIDNWKTHPTREVCGSCHTTVDFATGTGHGGGAQANDGGCAFCHPATGTLLTKSVTEAHAAKVNAMDVPEYDVTITLSDPANKATQEAKTPPQLPYYVAGETISITATLKDHATGNPVAATVYDQTTAGTKGLADGILNAATLYVYGPRSGATPLVKVYGTNGLLTQTINLLGTGDANGFHYDVTVPADATAGTYIVRTKFADFGYVSASSYQLDSIAFTPIQIGTATVQKKVAGDACMDCHGTGLAEFHNARHSVHFDTDECLACHDQSGNHAAMIANRIHAVHSASPAGDMVANRDWTAVTYPQKVTTCTSCHNSGATTYQTVILGTVCMGCHGDDQATMSHMEQNGFVNPKE